MSMFKTGVKCIPFLPKVRFTASISAIIDQEPKIIPAFTSAVRTSTARLQNFHLEQLAILISLISAHIRNFTPQIFALVAGLTVTSAVNLIVY